MKKTRECPKIDDCFLYWSPIGALLELYWNPIGTLLALWSQMGANGECVEWRPLGIWPHAQLQSASPIHPCWLHMKLCREIKNNDDRIKMKNETLPRKNTEVTYLLVNKIPNTYNENGVIH